MSSKPEITILLADDHPLYRSALRKVLEESQMHVVAEAATGEEAVSQALRTHPDVVVMDVRMPVMDGIEATRRLRAELPDTAVVLITGMPEDQGQLLRAVDAGARSYMGKHESTESLLDAIHAVVSGAAFLPPEIAKLLLARLAQPARPAREPTLTGRTLTERETQVLRMLSQGRRLKDIAVDLGVSPRTVGNHISSIYRKLNVSRRADAVVYAVKEGLLSG
jgi:DNA-binding NarL/FixJ family response regulator